jgi:DNA-binding response OmpR family regulator
MTKKKKIKSVLVIEDEADIRNFISRVLELEGYDVFKASDGIVGMEILKEQPIDLVLLDLRMPGPDGWSILKEIKRNPDFAPIPVVVLTAIAETIQRRKTLRMGASSYLIKPLSSHVLSKVVANVLRGKRTSDRLLEQNIVDRIYA